MEGYFETIVKHRKTVKEQLLGFSFILAGFAGAIVVWFLASLMRLHALGIMGGLVAIFFGFRAAVLYDWEYEYVVTTGSVDIDQIIAERKRKRMISFDCRGCEIIAPLNRGNYFAPYKELPCRDLTAYTAHEDNYFAVFERSGVRTCVLFQPTEDMVQMFRQYNPQKVFLA